MHRSLFVFLLLLLFLTPSQAQTLYKQEAGYFAALDVFESYVMRSSVGYRLDAAWDLSLNLGADYSHGPGNPILFVDGTSLPQQRTKLRFLINPAIGYTGWMTSHLGLRAEAGAFMHFTTDTTWVARNVPWMSKYGLNSELSVFRSMRLGARLRFQPSLGAFTELARYADTSKDWKRPSSANASSRGRNRFVAGPVLRLPLLIQVFQDKVLVAELYHVLGLTPVMINGQSRIDLGRFYGGLSIGFNF